MKKRTLIVCPDSSTEHRVVLEDGVYKIGRSRIADIRLENPNISGLHLSVVVRGDKAELIDLDSTNGTSLNGKKISRALLADGDRISLADSEILFQEESIHSTEVQDVATTVIPRQKESLCEAIRSLAETAIRSGETDEQTVDELTQRVMLLERTGQLLDSLNELVTTVMGHGDRRAIIRALLGELGRLIDLDMIGMFTVDEELFYLLRDSELVVEESVEGVSRTVLDNVLSTGKPVIIEQVGDNSQVVGFASLVRFKVQSVLSFPVKGRAGSVLGVVYCVSRELDTLRLLEQDHRFLDACSSACALALENISLINSLRKQTRREERSAAQQRYSPLITRLNQQRENLSLKLVRQSRVDYFGLDLPCNSDVREFVAKTARANLPVLLTGDTGTGKSALAHVIHAQGGAAGALVTIDCTTLPGELLESELFGHEKGAFTGAHTRKAGKVSGAQGGTLFLDEIGELPLNLQAKLLRLIQSGEYEPVGGTKTVVAQVRLIVATNRNLRREVEKRTFREDLYFRLNVLCFECVPLRQKPELIPLMANHFLKGNASRLNPAVSGFSADSIQVLLHHAWPGNVRELENAVMRGLVNCTSSSIEPNHLELSPSTLDSSPEPENDLDSEPPTMDLKLAREKLDRKLIARALEQTGHTVSRAARVLSISRNSLMDLMKKYGL